MTTVSTALLAAIATRVPGMTIANALGLVEDFERFGYRQEGDFDFSTIEGRAAFARTLPSVMVEVAGDKKIQAIKQLRQAMQDRGGLAAKYSGLKETKDSIDSIMGVNPYRY